MALQKISINRLLYEEMLWEMDQIAHLLYEASDQTSCHSLALSPGVRRIDHQHALRPPSLEGKSKSFCKSEYFEQEQVLDFISNNAVLAHKPSSSREHPPLAHHLPIAPKKKNSWN